MNVERLTATILHHNATTNGDTPSGPALLEALTADGYAPLLRRGDGSPYSPPFCLLQSLLGQCKGTAEISALASTCLQELRDFSRTREWNLRKNAEERRDAEEDRANGIA